MREYLDDNVVQQADLFGIQQGSDDLPLVPEENNGRVLAIPGGFSGKKSLKQNGGGTIF